MLPPHALDVAIHTKRRFVIHSSDYDGVAAWLQAQARGRTLDLAEVDLAPEPSVPDLLRPSSIVVWRNMERCSRAYQKHLGRFLAEIDSFDTVESRLHPSPSVSVGGTTFVPPVPFVIVAVINPRPRPHLYFGLKAHFLFAIHVPDASSFETTDPLRLAPVFLSPEVHQYIYSLVVFTRCHRLTSLAPADAKLPTRTIDAIDTLARALAAIGGKRFVTPSHVKEAFLLVAYWLVDWETNPLFANLDTDIDAKKTEINMLTGNWYGSSWPHVREYLRLHKSSWDLSLPTGWTNKLVDDALHEVRPPL